MSLNTQIISIIQTLYPTAQLILSSKFSGNIQSFSLTSVQMPVVIFDNELSNTSEIKKNNNVQKDSKILINFLDKDSSSNTDVQSEVIRAAMEAMADKVAANIFELTEVRPKGNQQYKITPAFHAFASDLTGVALEIQCNYNMIVDFSLIPTP